MFGSSQVRGANAYAKVGIETGVVAASPHKLIVMLFEGAIVAISNASQHLSNGEIASKGQSISKAIAIIENGLRASLDKKAGGEIADNLDALYEYMTARLIKANLENNDGMLNEVRNLLKDLKASWEAIAPASEAVMEAPKMNVDPLSPRPANFVEA
ncbi:flagellar export chaperone FliS [Undibacterium sp. Di26W]|uniref:flagellar export chaperone FliS n=1 Tax=Undibacterium sp. Di26W TaxID=3413035 RepID=UPI003BF0A3BF